MKTKKDILLNFIKVNYNYLNQRIDNFLIREIKFISKNDIYYMLRKGKIKVNKKKIKFFYKLKQNDIINLPFINLKKKQKILNLNKKTIFEFRKNIIYEDKLLLVINKPYGIPVHSGKNISNNIIDIYKYIKSDLKYLQLVHRIDMYASGILLLSKNKKFLCILQKYLKENNIKKEYIALVHGKFPKSIKYLDNYLYKKNNIGKYSKTLFKIKKYINNYTLLKIKPLTGRHHQIRIHTSNLGYPIVGDKIYGIKKNKNIKNNRLYLHSYSISFFHPYKKKIITFKSKLDNSFYFFIKNIKNKNFR